MGGGGILAEGCLLVQPLQKKKCYAVLKTSALCKGRRNLECLKGCAVNAKNNTCAKKIENHACAPKRNRPGKVDRTSEVRSVKLTSAW